MPLKAIICPHCNKKMLFTITSDDVDLSSGKLPAPLYVKHSSKICQKTTTVYLDSDLRISLMDKGIEDGSKWKFVKSVNSLDDSG